MPLASMLVLSAISSQVHLRTPGLATTQSVTSIADTAPIIHLRTGNMVDALDDWPTGGAEHQLWTGPYADAAHLDFTCSNYNTPWPNVYQACGTDGMHIWNQHTRWNWDGGDTTQNIAMEVYVR